MKRRSLTRVSALLLGLAFFAVYLAACAAVTLREARSVGDPTQYGGVMYYRLQEAQTLMDNRMTNYRDLAAFGANSLEYMVNALLEDVSYLNFGVENASCSAAVLRARYDGKGGFAAVEQAAGAAPELSGVLGQSENVLFFVARDEALETRMGDAAIYLDRVMSEEEALALCLTLTRERVRYDAVSWRFTGVLTGGALLPETIECRLWDSSTGRLGGYEVLYRAQTPPAGESVTLYSDGVRLRTRGRGHMATEGGELDREGTMASMRREWQRTDGLTEELERAIALKYSENGPYTFTKYGLTDTRIELNVVADDPLSDGESALLCLTALFSFSPLAVAAENLLSFYLWLLAAALLAALTLLLLLRRYVARPLRRLSDDYSAGFKRTQLNAPGVRLREIAEIAEQYDSKWRDVDEARSDARRFERAAKSAEASEQNRRRMTSGIAHELKTPLAIIHSYAEGLREHIAEDKREHYLDVILSETERMDAMVLEMLNLSRMEAGRTKLLKESFSLRELAQGVFTRLQAAVAAKSLHIEFDAPEPCTVFADPDRIEQVITNFATNAIRHTPSGGRIRVLVYSLQGRAKLYVENEGQQIPEAELPRLWESFYRAEESRHGEGTGLGLAIARSIVELHGGVCVAANVPGGVRFGFEL